MILAKLKDTDIAARPEGRRPGAGRARSPRCCAAWSSRAARASMLYRQGNRPELAAKEEAEIAVIECFLPAADGRGRDRGARWPTAIAATGAAGVKDMGKVMAALKAQHARDARHGARRRRWCKREARRLMALPAGFLDELRARTPLAALIGRRVQAGPRPGGNGRAAARSTARRRRASTSTTTTTTASAAARTAMPISFVMQSAGRRASSRRSSSWPPRPGWRCRSRRPAPPQAERRRHDLHAVLEAAAAAFQRRLFLPEGRARRSTICAAAG